MQIHDSLRELIGIAGRALNEVAVLQIDFYDHASLCAYAFLHRQTELARSVSHLIDADLHPGTALIARTMLEGAMTLHWVLLDSEQHRERRAKLWRAWTWAEDKQKLKHSARFGYSASQEQIARVEKELANFTELFKREGKLHDSWTIDEAGRKLTKWDLFESHKKAYPAAPVDAYPLYKDLSAYVHWSPGGFDVVPVKDNWEFRQASDKKVRAALALSILSLGMVLNLTAAHFELSVLAETKDFLGKVSLA
jgi:hypothetical protein